MEQIRCLHTVARHPSGSADVYIKYTSVDMQNTYIWLRLLAHEHNVNFVCYGKVVQKILINCHFGADVLLIIWKFYIFIHDQIPSFSWTEVMNVVIAYKGW